LIPILSYPYLVLTFTLCFALFFLLQRRESGFASAARNLPESEAHELRWFALAVISLVLPRVIYAIQNPTVFASPDILSYAKDSDQFLTGRIPAISSELWNEDRYYAGFPIVAMLLTILRSVTGLDSIVAVHVVNTIVQILFWLAAWLVLTKVLNISAPTYSVSMAIVIAGFANPYLYGYFDTLLPQNLGLCLILLLLYTSMKSGIDFGVTFILLSVFSIVHVTTIPVFLTIAVMLRVVNTFQARRLGYSSNRSSLAGRWLIVPVLAFVAYLSGGAIISVNDYGRYIMRFFQQVGGQALTGNVDILGGLSRGDLVGINSLAPALIVGSTGALVLFYLYSFFKRRDYNTELASIAIVALALMSAAALRQRVDVWSGVGAFGSISRYFGAPGYAIATLVVCWQLANILPRSRGNYETVVFYALLFLTAVGGLLDPLAHLHG
jgi:hypothetical protein